MALVKFTALPSTNEKVDICYINNPDFPPLVEYKFIFYKYPKPLNKNITSIQVMLLGDNLPYNNSLYISLYANIIQLSSPIKIFPNRTAEILHYLYIPSQLTPDYQLQLLATIENVYILNVPSQYTGKKVGTEIEIGVPKNERTVKLIKETNKYVNNLNIQIQVTTKYSLFDDTNTFEKLIIHHKYDSKTLVFKNGKLCYYNKCYI